MNILPASERFISASEHIAYQSFKLFTSKFIELNPGIQSLSWNPKVMDKNREEFEKEVRKQDFPDFVIRDRFGVGKIEPAPRREAYYPAAYVYP